MDSWCFLEIESVHAYSSDIVVGHPRVLPRIHRRVDRDYAATGVADGVVLLAVDVSVGGVANLVMPPRNKSAVRKNYNFFAVSWLASDLLFCFRHLPNFRRLVLGCIEADVYKPNFRFEAFSWSTCSRDGLTRHISRQQFHNVAVKFVKRVRSISMWNQVSQFPKDM